MPDIRKFKNRMKRVKELAQSSFFTYFPIMVSDRSVHKFLDLKKIGGGKTRNIDEVKSLVYSYFCNRQGVAFYFNEKEKAEILDILSKHYPDSKAETLNEADWILDHKIKIFGPTRYALGKTIDWSLDILSGKKWPLTYYKTIRIHAQNIQGDVLYTAQLNRHQHLTTLARAYLYSKDSRYSEEIINQIVSWIQKNPYKIGINWSPLIASQRALSWIWCLAIVGFPNIYPERCWEILKSLYLHARFIEENLSLNQEYPNNHLIGEAAALAILGLFFPEFRKAGEWKQKGLKILEEQLSTQFFESGVHKEQALAYHLLVTEFYTQVYLLCTRHKINNPSLLKKLEQMYEVLVMICQPGGTAPMWGDNSELRAVNLSDQKNEPLSSFFSIGSVLFNRADMKKLCGKFTEEALWLLTAEGYYKFQDLKGGEIEHSSYAYKDAGIFVMRDGWQQASRYLVVDCGRQGLGKAGHGHADMLSFELWANGKKLIIDPGTFTYNGAYKWRQYFRGTSAHNTVVVDGLDQSEPKPLGRFGWNRLAYPNLDTWYTSKDFDYFAGEHDGYERLAQPVRHHRKILFIKGEYWILSDILTGEGTHQFDCLFHFPPGEVSLNREDQSLIAGDMESSIKITPLHKGIEAEVIEGSEDPIQGWVSYEYGSKIRAPVLRYTKRGELPAFLDVILYPFIGKDAPYIKVEDAGVYNKQGSVLDPLEARCLRIQINEVEDYYLFSMRDKAVKYFEKFTTNGKMVYLRKLNGKIIKSLMIGGTFLTYKNNPVEPPAL